ncbi:MAG: putative cullin 1 [Streblomastix strix]|uniref:Putative cullin 1 n=1 Tax=Streblomastix strix TaxID=222440 RepID=A0A5J4WK95_9EUKA|nr:MAG: putative cullin 1 [Streblomastix strix]
MALTLDELNSIRDINDAWTRYLKPTIDEIIKLIDLDPNTVMPNESDISRFTSIIEHLCQKLGSTNEVAEHALNIFVDYCENNIIGVLKSLKDGPYLLELADRWNKFKIFAKIICDLFKYLDNNYFNIERPSGSNGVLLILNLQQRAYNIFKDQIFANQIEMIEHLILDFIDQERSGETVDNSMLKNMFITLDPTLQQFYKHLEDEFLQRTRSFYQKYSQSMIETETVPDFIIKCENAFNNENERVEKYMNPSTQPKIREILDEELLRKNAHWIVQSKESGFLVLLDHNKIEDIGRMYRLMTHLDNSLGIDAMVQDFRTHIQSAGENLMLTQNVPPRLIQEIREVKEEEEEEEKEKEKLIPSQIYIIVDQVISLFRRVNRMHQELFQNLPQFGTSIQDAFSEFLNDSRSKYWMKFTESLAIYVDELMKSSLASTLNDQIQTRFDEIVGVLQYVQQKDVFINSHQYLLSQRILNQAIGESEKIEVEKVFIDKLKIRFGDSYTYKLDAMFKDLLPQVKLQQLEDDQQQGLNLGFDLQAQILTKASWSILKRENVNLPDNLQQALQSFQHLYKKIKPEREIEWFPKLGSMVVEVQFAQKKCNITMESTQALVLLNFANGAQLSVNDLSTLLKIDKDEIMMNVISLMSRPPLLIRVYEGSQGQTSIRLKDDDQLKLNKELKPKKKNFRAQRLTDQSQLKTLWLQQLVLDERKTKIDGTIVYLTRELVNNAIAQITNFIPSSFEVKQRIEDLIEREFLKRAEQNPNIIQCIY